MMLSPVALIPPVEDPACGAVRGGEVYPPLEGGQVRHSASADKP